MPTPQETELLPYLEELLTATKAGKIKWVRPNPSTYVWDIPTKGRITLQQTATVKMRPGPSGIGQVARQLKLYILQVFDVHNTVRMNYQGDEESPEGNKIGELFDEITSIGKKESLEFMESLLPR